MGVWIFRRQEKREQGVRFPRWWKTVEIGKSFEYLHVTLTVEVPVRRRLGSGKSNCHWSSLLTGMIFIIGELVNRVCQGDHNIIRAVQLQARVSPLTAWTVFCNDKSTTSKVLRCG